MAHTRRYGSRAPSSSSPHDDKDDDAATSNRRRRRHCAGRLLRQFYDIAFARAKRPVRQALIDGVNRERDGEAIDRALPVRGADLMYYREPPPVDEPEPPEVNQWHRGI